VGEGEGEGENVGVRLDVNVGVRLDVNVRVGVIVLERVLVGVGVDAARPAAAAKSRARREARGALQVEVGGARGGPAARGRSLIALKKEGGRSGRPETTHTRPGATRREPLPVQETGRQALQVLKDFRRAESTVHRFTC
jgi:hypothetical protein